MEIIHEKLTAIGDAIREKTGGTEPLTLDDMAVEIAGISTGVETGDATAIAEDILSGKTAYVNGEKITGNIPVKTSADLTVSGETVVIPGGYYAEDMSKSVETADQATPSVSVDANGIITATATQTAGYVVAGTKSGTKQLTVQDAQVITPSVSNQTIASGTYLIGEQIIEGDSNLVAENILKGKSIFGVSGSYDGVKLGFSVVGSTSQPSNPIEGMIWVNTSTVISGYSFSVDQPASPTNGYVWFSISTSSPGAFNALIDNKLDVYPTGCLQYISGTWVSQDAKTYINGSWTEWILYLYNKGVFSETYGGLNNKGLAFSGGEAETGNIRLDASSVRLWPNSGRSFIAYFSKMVDLTPYKQLCYYGNAVVHNSYGGIAAFGIGVWNSSFGAVSILQGARSTGLHTIDVSNINGQYYIGIAIRGFTDYNSCTMEQMYLK